MSEKQRDPYNPKPLGTVKHGKVKIYSEKQMAYLHFKHLPHTHFKYADGKVVKTRHLK